MQAVTFRARVAAPVGLTARVARAHTAKAFAAPRTKGASKRPVVLVRAAEGAPHPHTNLEPIEKGTRETAT